MRVDGDRGEGTTYGLADERGCVLVVVHAGGWVVGGKEGMLTVWVIVTVRVQLEKERDKH